MTSVSVLTPPSLVPPVPVAISELAAGRPVLIHDREHELAAIAQAASAVDQPSLRFMLEHGSGMICVALSAERADHLQLPGMLTAAEGKFTVSVDLEQTGTDTVSDRGRADTVRALAAPDAKPDEFSRPGHVFPIVCDDDGVLGQVDLAEAAFDLARLGSAPGAVAAFSRLTDTSGLAAPLTTRLQLFAEDHGLVSVAVEELANHRLKTEQLVRLVVETRLPTTAGVFDAQGWESELDATELMSLRVGEVAANGPAQVAIHPACQAGDVFGSISCGCAERLRGSLEILQETGRGVLIYLRGDEKLGFTECGAERVAADSYAHAAQILRALRVDAVELIAPTPAAESGLRSYGFEVSPADLLGDDG